MNSHFSLTHASLQPPTHAHNPSQIQLPRYTARPNQMPVPAYCRTLCFANNREQAHYYSPLPPRPKNGTRLGFEDDLSYRFDKAPKKHSSQKSPVVKSYKQTKGEEVDKQGSNYSTSTNQPTHFLCFQSVPAARPLWGFCPRPLYLYTSLHCTDPTRLLCYLNA